MGMIGFGGEIFQADEERMEMEDFFELEFLGEAEFADGEIFVAEGGESKREIEALIRRVLDR